MLLRDTQLRIDEVLQQASHKDARAVQWCADVTNHTGVQWYYLKVPDKEYKKLRPTSFDELVSALQAGGPMFVVE